MRKLRRNAGGKHAKLATFILIERHKQRPYHRSPDSSLSHEALQAKHCRWPLLTHGKAASLPLFSACFLFKFFISKKCSAKRNRGTGNFFLLVAERGCHFLPKTTLKMGVKPSPFEATLLRLHVRTPTNLLFATPECGRRPTQNAHENSSPDQKTN